MRKAIFTVFINGPTMTKELQEAYSLGVAQKAAYAQRIGADFVLKSAPSIRHNDWPSHERLEMGDMFDKYDRILYLDADTIIRPSMPDMFALLPDDKIYMLKENPTESESEEWGYNTNEDYMSETVRPCIREFRSDYPDMPWYPYYNAGVMMCPKKYREAVTYKPDYFEHYRFEQDWVNYNIFKHGMEVDCLPYAYNAIWLFNKDKANHTKGNHIIHYIGVEKEKIPAMMCRDYYKMGGIHG